jgi:alkanesulfonate monooxygenase SsuD/methylene tetrahydromethanopterin reductase-like flavin-dependent oxidoreductase (luciferase family)
VVGIGRGNRPLEFFGHGVTQDQSRTRMEEGVEVLLRAWTTPRVSFHGEHWHIDNIPVHPQPVQQPHPPIAIAATSDQSIAWAAERGFRLLSSGLGSQLDALKRQRAIYADALATSTMPRPDARPSRTNAGISTRSPVRSAPTVCRSATRCVSRHSR